MAWHERAVGYQSVFTLLGYRYHTRFHGIVCIDVAQVHVYELHARHNLELLLYASSSLDRILKEHLRVILGHHLVGEQQLGQAAEVLAHAYLVALVEVAVEPEVLVDEVRIVALAHLAAELC